MPGPIHAVVQYIILFSLFLLDYFMGNGLIDLIQKQFCKVLCFIKKVLANEAKMAGNISHENPVSFPVLFLEIAVLTITIVILNKYKQYRSGDRIDELLDESKEALRQTNEFLEKWRLRRVHWQSSKDSLDEEATEYKSMKVEIPILHMAMVDTHGTTRSLERGDAGDSANITDSAILSVTSMDDEFDSPDGSILDDIKNDLNNRYLWNVAEETSYSEPILKLHEHYNPIFMTGGNPTKDTLVVSNAV